jgi:hypothetical protein
MPGCDQRLPWADHLPQRVGADGLHGDPRVLGRLGQEEPRRESVIAPDTKHGKAFEKELISRWESLGKRAWYYRFDDVADLFGLNKTVVLDFPKPADFLMTYNGWTSLIECKATKDAKGFRTSLMRKFQVIAATRMVAAQGNYFVAVKRMLDGAVYFVPAKLILSTSGTIPWDVLAQYHWTGTLPPCLTTPT